MPRTAHVAVHRRAHDVAVLRTKPFFHFGEHSPAAYQPAMAAPVASAACDGVRPLANDASHVVTAFVPHENCMDTPDSASATLDTLYGEKTRSAAVDVVSGVSAALPFTRLRCFCHDALQAAMTVAFTAGNVGTCWRYAATASAWTS